jgi:hypothetical protein
MGYTAGIIPWSRLESAVTPLPDLKCPSRLSRCAAQASSGAMELPAASIC